MEQEEQKKESPIDRASDLYSKYQNLRQLGRLGRAGGRLAVQAGARAGTAAIGAIGAAGWPVLVAVGAVFIITFVIVLAGENLTGRTKTAEASSFLGYQISFRDNAVSPPNRVSVEPSILAEFPQAKLDYWDNIVTQSVQDGWNPAFVLALWIEETGASHHTKLSVGGAGIPAGYNSDGTPRLSNGHLGCAPNEDQTIDESLRCLFKNFPIDKYPNEKFADFMCVYGGDGFHSAPCVFEKENPDFPGRIKKYYSLLIPSGLGIVETITNVSCPVAYGTVSYGSYQYDVSGHCRPSHGSCDPNSRKAKSIDVPSRPGDPVLLPAIEGQAVAWQYFDTPSYTAEGEGGGRGYVFVAGEWTLHLVHLDPSTIKITDGARLQPGDVVGSVIKDHVHVSTGRNVAGDPRFVPAGANDLRPEWISPEDLGMCR